MSQDFMTPEEDRAMWEDIARRIRERREQEDGARKAHNDAIDWSWLPERCPDCRLLWTIWPPAKIENGSRFHTGECRCVECKRVYSPPSQSGTKP